MAVERRDLKFPEEVFDRPPHPPGSLAFRTHRHDFPCESTAEEFSCTRKGCEWTDGQHVGWHIDEGVSPPAVWPP